MTARAQFEEMRRRAALGAGESADHGSDHAPGGPSGPYL
jgi:hypothetical protein